MRILITGASGFLGWNVCRRFVARGDADVLATRNKSPVPPEATPIDADFDEPASASRAVEKAKPDAIVHCAALATPGVCERDPDRAFRVNAEATARLLDAAGVRGAYAIVCSTDLVFDGTRGDYREDDPVRPLMTYGRTKVAAEQAAARAPGEVAVVRLSLMYGPPAPFHASFVGWLDDGLRGGGVTLFTDEYRTATHVDDVAGAFDVLIERRATGCFHVAGPERQSRAEFGRLYADVFGLDPAAVVEKTQGEGDTGAPRPADVSLNIGKARRALGFDPMTPRKGLERLRESLERSAT